MSFSGILDRTQATMLTNIRIDNDDKLREKVQEALAVYDEYVKNAGGEPQEPDGNPDEAGKEAEAEPEAAKA